KDDRLEFNWYVYEGFGMAQQEISAGLQRVIESAKNPEAALLGEVHQHVHAKDAVDFADIHGFDKVHLCEGDHSANARLHLKSSFGIIEMGFNLAERDILEAALGIDAAFGVPQGAAADIRGENFNLPRLREFERVDDCDRHGIRFLAGGTACAPNAQRPGIFPKLSFLHFGEDAFLERFKNSWIAKEGGLLGKQPLEQRLVLDARAAHVRQQIGSAGQALFLEIFPQTSGKKSLARRIEQNCRAVLDQGANLVELGLREPGGRDWVRFHVRRSAPAAIYRWAECAVSDAPPLAWRGALLPQSSRIHRLERTGNGIAPALHSAARKV